MTDQSQMGEELFTTHIDRRRPSGVLTASCERVTEKERRHRAGTSQGYSPLEIGIVNVSFQNAPRSVAAGDSAHERR
jgi:hypothetical protein